MSEDLSHYVDSFSRPSATFDLCVIEWCNTSVPITSYGNIRI
jgi:hypothetical protein